MTTTVQVKRGALGETRIVESADAPLGDGEVHEYCVLVRPAANAWAARVPLRLLDLASAEFRADIMSKPFIKNCA